LLNESETFVRVEPLNNTSNLRHNINPVNKKLKP
jgi:hypothetical protein